jgi:membrane-associated protease RseP (regulator of RpoE activity)
LAAVWAIVILLFVGFMIITHEAGHFFAAKAVGITPKTFSIGFGPEIVGWDRGGTRYAIKWFLAGGSVQILGMNPDEEISDEDWPRSYYANPPWKRAVVIVAGSFVHICIAFFLLWLVFWATGLPGYLDSSKVGDVSRTVPMSSGKDVAGPGFKAGLQKGDVITSVNGIAVRSWEGLTNELRKRPGQQVTIVVRRGDKTLTFQTQLLNDAGTGRLGIGRATRMEKTNPLYAVARAGKALGSISAALGKGIASLFSVRTLKVLIGTQQRNQESPQSIVGATRLTFQAAHQGASVFLFWVAYLFFFLAIFNLLPLPPLDGGYLLVIVIEKLFRKKIDVRKLVPVAWAVIVVLSLVAIRLAMLDIFNPLKNPFK